jgi:hypothetical protein
LDVTGGAPAAPEAIRRADMDYVCPKCSGPAYLLETGSDGRVMIMCAACDAAVPSDALPEADRKDKTPKRSGTS